MINGCLLENNYTEKYKDPLTHHVCKTNSKQTFYSRKTVKKVKSRMDRFGACYGSDEWSDVKVLTPGPGEWCCSQGLWNILHTGSSWQVQDHRGGIVGLGALVSVFYHGVKSNGHLTFPPLLMEHLSLPCLLCHDGQHPQIHQPKIELIASSLTCLLPRLVKKLV